MAKWIKNNSGSTSTYNGQDIADDSYYQIKPEQEKSWSNNSTLLADIGSGDAVVAKDDSGDNDITDVAEAITYLRSALPDGVDIAGVEVRDNRLQNMNNRVPNGFTLYVTGTADAISAGGYGAGDDMQFSSSNQTRDFQLLEHYYAIGARAIWKNCDIDNYFNATLVAPASSGAAEQAGDFDKYEIIPSSGLHMFIPTAEGEGDWDMDLAETFTGTNVLKATPVPAAGNNGWFDYNSSTNVLTPNMSQEGGYNLYDFEVNLHALGRKVWGSPLNGAVSELDVSDLVGKLLFNTWKIRLHFDVEGILGSEKAAAVLILATKKNI